MNVILPPATYFIERARHLHAIAKQASRRAHDDTLPLAARQRADAACRGAVAKAARFEEMALDLITKRGA